ncbi:Spx/MgsR family RNA polymerase-binding regulatory protein [Allobaculum sp. JKK-2023]|uniref:Spx/MgsR family RNA polymerase-binding regulatory protein n=1 Tax=Allobaculum sp. JKK-2023 TaxID=3108943 RepID=UPI002B06006A|nr:Spx/MgsR family RNA polymerase-binding regulatory protein [Allobaculum sp. JKK-2023]
MNASVLFYTSPGCANCRKAKKWLEDNHIDFVEKNIFNNELSEQEVKYLLARCENGTEDILSTRSKAYASLKEVIDDMSVNDLTHFIQKNPSVLKRPILLSRRNMAVGYDHDEITTMMPLEKRRAAFQIGVEQPRLSRGTLN